LIDKNTEISLPYNFFYLIAFVEGGAVLATELICAQLFAPYFGNSLQTWAVILISTLTALTAGYFSGGYLSKKKTEDGRRKTEERSQLFFLKSDTLLHKLNLCLLVATLAIILQPFIAGKLIPVTLNTGIITGAFISAIFILLPPLFFLGMLSPMLIQILSADTTTSGKTSGLIYAISTSGGILFTFLFGFFLIPHFGMKTAIVLNSLIPATLTGYLLLSQKKNVFFWGFSLIMLSFFLLGINTGDTNQKVKKSYIKVHYNEYGLLGQLTVADDNLAHSRSLFINHISQSFMYIPSGRSLWHYVHRLTHYCSVKSPSSKVLLAGMGGGLLVKELTGLHFIPDVIELDERMKNVSEKYFGLNAKINFHTDDFRHYVKTTFHRYDIIIIDISFGENQPSNIYTMESFMEIKKLLKEDGLFFIHFPDFLYGEEGLAVRSVGKTLIESGFFVKLLNTKHKPGSPGEIIFLATHKPVALENYLYDQLPEFTKQYKFPTKNNLYLEGYSFEGGVILSDDKPIMDFLHEKTVMFSRKEGIEIVSKTLLEQGYGIF